MCELRNLTEAGILLRERHGRHIYYRANTQCPIYPELRGLVLKTVGLADVLRAALAPLELRIDMVIGDVSPSEVISALTKSQEILGREVNPSVYPPQEFRRRAEEGNHFISTVSREPKIMLIGDEDDLSGLAS